MPDYENIEILDSHHHFWDLDKNYYPFLSDKIDPDFFLGNYEMIRQNYLPVDYEKDIKNHNVIGTIHCEAEWDRNDQVGETKWIENLSKKNKFVGCRIPNNKIQMLNSKRKKIITGKAGTLIIVDTSLIHRGRPLKNGKRYALTNYYYPYYQVNKMKNHFKPRIN